MAKDQSVLEAKKVEWMRLQIQRLASAESERDEADRRKDEFLLTLSHELRTPLTPVLGWTRLIRSSDYDKPTVIRGMEVIERNVVAEIALVEDILDLSRIVAGDLKLQRTSILLKEAVASAVGVVQLDADNKLIAITNDVKESIDPVDGDPNRVQQVFYNLLKNAVKFTPDRGSIHITAASDGPYVKVVVSDTGEGIDARHLSRVFNRFNMQDGSITRRHGGLGIGLSIVKRIVELHGGRVEAYSGGVGQGSTFTVWLPKYNVPLTPASAASLASAPTERRLTGARILIVDDDQDTLDFLSMALQRVGANVRCATSVPIALELIQDFNPTILLSDIGIPQEDGYSLIRKLRQARNSIPAIAISAFAGPKEHQSSIAAGYLKHLSKPLDPNELICLLSELDSSATASDP